MEPTTIATLCTEIWKSETFQHFLSDAASRIVGEYTRHKFIDNGNFQEHGKNLPELADAERRYLEAKNDREQQGLELQKLHLAYLYRQSQENIALTLQKIQSDQDMAHWSGLLSREETVHLLTGAKNKHRLLLVLSEPDVSPSCPDSFRHDFPREARAEVKQFIEHYYPLSSEFFPVEFYGKFFRSTVFDTQVKQLENTLSVVPGVVLYSDLTDEKLYLHLHTWGFLEPLSKTVVWNWEDAKELLREGHGEKQALRAVRQIIVALYQSFAGLLADLYYLHVNPLHEPVLLGLTANKAIAEMMAPHIDYLKTLRNQVRQAYEASLPGERARLVDTRTLEQEYAEFIRCEDHSDESAERFLESHKGRLSAWRTLADQGNARAQCLVGWMLERGLGVTKDYEEAVRYYRLAAEQGFARGQSYLGHMYESGWGVRQDNQEALQWYRRAAEQGDPSGQTRLGNMHFFGSGGLARNFEEAIWWQRKAADQGGASYQSSLGFKYWFRGNCGEAKYFKDAVVWYRKAAEQASASAQTWLGGMHRDGKGVDRNYAEALKWYRKAAEQGDPYSQNDLGEMYRDGLGVARDYREAVRWFRQSMESKYVIGYGAMNLAEMYEHGLGVERDYREAVHLYRLAAEEAISEVQGAKEALERLRKIGYG